MFDQEEKPFNGAGDFQPRVARGLQGHMAICGFRADNYSFSLLEADGLDRLISLLEKARSGFPLAEAGEKGSSWIEAFQRSGLVSLQRQQVFLAPKGEALLKSYQCLQRKVPS